VFVKTLLGRNIRPCAPLSSGEHGVEQAGEEKIQVIPAQRHPPLVAPAACSGDASFAQHAQVLGEGRLRDVNLEGPAQPFTARLDLAHDREPGRVAQRVQHSGEIEAESDDIDRTSALARNERARWGGERRMTLACMPTIVTSFKVRPSAIS
jgi:hypothetical protein